MFDVMKHDPKQFDSYYVDIAFVCEMLDSNYFEVNEMVKEGYFPKACGEAYEPEIPIWPLHKVNLWIDSVKKTRCGKEATLTAEDKWTALFDE